MLTKGHLKHVNGNVKENVVVSNNKKKCQAGKMSGGKNMLINMNLFEHLGIDLLNLIVINIVIIIA